MPQNFFHANSEESKQLNRIAIILHGVDWVTMTPKASLRGLSHKYTTSWESVGYPRIALRSLNNLAWNVRPIYSNIGDGLALRWASFKESTIVLVHLERVSKPCYRWSRDHIMSLLTLDCCERVHQDKTHRSGRSKLWAHQFYCFSPSPQLRPSLLSYH